MAVEIRCRKHPGYMAQRRPRAKCAMCFWLWNVVCDLTSAEAGREYVLRFFRKVNRG